MGAGPTLTPPPHPPLRARFAARAATTSRTGFSSNPETLRKSEQSKRLDPDPEGGDECSGFTFWQQISFGNMEPSGIVDDSFRSLFDRVAEIIHEQGGFEQAHKTLNEHFRYLEKGNSRAVYEIPSKVADEANRLVVKFALPESGNSGTEEALYPEEYTEGWMSNWHEIILTDFAPLEDVIVPVLDHHEDALWTVMPYAETLPQSQEVTQRLGPLTAKIEETNVEFVSHGQTTGQPEIYQIKAWGNYQDEYRLRDYGGIVVADEGFLEQLPYPLSEPDI